VIAFTELKTNSVESSLSEIILKSLSTGNKRVIGFVAKPYCPIDRYFKFTAYYAVYSKTPVYQLLQSAFPRLTPTGICQFWCKHRLRPHSATHPIKSGYRFDGGFKCKLK
jgi:hypothetical protein